MLHKTKNTKIFQWLETVEVTLLTQLPAEQRGREPNGGCKLDEEGLTLRRRHSQNSEIH